jgi:hypothetical protein
MVEIVVLVFPENILEVVLLLAGKTFVILDVERVNQ